MLKWKTGCAAKLSLRMPTKRIGEGGNTAPRIPHLGTTWRYRVSVRPRTL